MCGGGQPAGVAGEPVHQVGGGLLGLPVCLEEVHQLDEGVARVGHGGGHVVGDVTQVRRVVPFDLVLEPVGELPQLSDVGLDAAVVTHPGSWAALLWDHWSSRLSRRRLPE